MIKTQLISLLMFLCSWTYIAADQVDFSDGWREQRFSLFSSNEFEPSGETLGIGSDDRLNVLEPSTSQALGQQSSALGLGGHLIRTAHRPDTQRR